LLKDILEIDAEEPMYSNIYGGFGEKKPRTHFSKSVTIRANSGGGAIPSVSIKPVHNKINQAKVDNMQPGDIAATQMNNSKNFGNAVNVDGKHLLCEQATQMEWLCQRLETNQKQ
jgi:hypothetical protein